MNCRCRRRDHLLHLLTCALCHQTCPTPACLPPRAPHITGDALPWGAAYTLKTHAALAMPTACTLCDSLRLICYTQSPGLQPLLLTLPAACLHTVCCSQQLFLRSVCRLYRSLRNLEQYTPCAPSSQGELLVPEGWQLHAMLNLSQGSDSVPALPFVALLVQPQEQALAILARGTLTAHEWGMDFSWNQTEEYNATFGAPVHWGFGSVFEEVWPGVQDALQALAVDSREVKQVGVFRLQLLARHSVCILLQVAHVWPAQIRLATPCPPVHC